MPPNYEGLPTPLPLMGVKVTPFESYHHASTSIREIIESERKGFSAAVNPEKIYRAHLDTQVKSLLNRADICICDGIGAAFAARILHGKQIRRITGISLFFELIRVAADRGWRVFLLGAAPEVNEMATQQLKYDYPSLQIVGRQDGYFKDTEKVVQIINDSGAQLLFVAMGSPKQEQWITDNRKDIDAPFCMGIGGTFDVVAGKVEWAPALFQKTGTEWLYRLVREPKRWRRQLALPKFIWLLCMYKLGLVKESQKAI